MSDIGCALLSQEALTKLKEQIKQELTEEFKKNKELPTSVDSFAERVESIVEPDIGRGMNYGPAWNALVMLGRGLHARGRFSHTPKIRELTEEQKQMSAEMIEEIIEIYNQYRKMAMSREV